MTIVVSRGPIRENPRVPHQGSTVRSWPTSVAAVVALAPIFASWLLKSRVWPRPFWIFYYDPETIYFYSGLSLLRGRMPENVDNPGTPLQMISAAVAAVTGATPLRYEQFFAAAQIVGLLLGLVGALAIFYGVMNDAPPLARVAAVWAYLLAPAALERLDIWGPEILYLPIGACALALFRLWLGSPSAGKAMAAGAVVGFGIATKFTFLIWAPALVLAMLSARRVRHAGLAAAGVGVGFLCGTVPVAREYGSMFRRLLYLSGAQHADQTWPVLLATSTAWQAFLALMVLLAAWHFRRPQLPLAVFAVLLFAFGVLAGARNPNFRYLLPSAFAVVALFAIAAASPRFTVTAQVVVLAVTAVLFGRAIAGDVRAHREKTADGLALRSEIASVLPNDAVTIYGWRAPVPSFALRVMTSDARDLSDVSRRYPREGHLSPWNGVVFLPTGACRWDYLVLQDEDLRRIPRGSYDIVTRVGGYAVARASRGAAVTDCR